MAEHNAPSPFPDFSINPDPVLHTAAQSDVSRLKNEYVRAVRALERDIPRDDEMRAALGRLDRARAYLCQALTVLDFSRGD